MLPKLAVLYNSLNYSIALCPNCAFFRSTRACLAEQSTEHASRMPFLELKEKLPRMRHAFFERKKA